METNRIQIKTLIVSLIALISVELATRFVALKTEYSPTVILGVARLLEIILIILVVQNWEKGTSSIGLERFKILYGIRRGLIWSACFGGIVFLVSLFLLSLGINPSKFIKTDLPSSHIEIFILFLVAGIVGPVAEEFFFRGILFGFFRQWGFGIAFVLSVILFTIAHPGFPKLSFSQIIGGMVFAIAYEVEKNLMVPIIVHVLGNVAILAMPLIWS
jgi:membrane protease YdiL (CAAX protease family)